MNVIDWDLKKVAIIVSIAAVLGLIIFLFVKIALPIMKTSDMTQNAANSGVANMNVQNVDKFNDKFKKYEQKNANKAVVYEMINSFKNSNREEDQTHIITVTFRGEDFDKNLTGLEKAVDKTPYASFSIKLEKDKKDYYCHAIVDVVEESKANRD